MESASHLDLVIPQLNLQSSWRLDVFCSESELCPRRAGTALSALKYCQAGTICRHRNTANVSMNLPGSSKVVLGPRCDGTAFTRRRHCLQTPISA